MRCAVPCRWKCSCWIWRSSRCRCFPRGRARRRDRSTTKRSGGCVRRPRRWWSCRRHSWRGSRPTRSRLSPVRIAGSLVGVHASLRTATPPRGRRAPPGHGQWLAENRGRAAPRQPGRGSRSSRRAQSGATCRGVRRLRPAAGRGVRRSARGVARHRSRGLRRDGAGGVHARGVAGGPRPARCRRWCFRPRPCPRRSGSPACRRRTSTAPTAAARPTPWWSR